MGLGIFQWHLFLSAFSVNGKSCRSDQKTEQRVTATESAIYILYAHTRVFVLVFFFLLYTSTLLYHFMF
jgi:hypothetical protein